MAQYENQIEEFGKDVKELRLKKGKLIELNDDEISVISYNTSKQ